MRLAAHTLTAWLLLALLMCVTGARATHARQEYVAVGDVRLHYWPGHERLARSLLPDSTALEFTGLPHNVLRSGSPVDVQLAPDAARWDSLTGGRAPEWGAGIALPYESRIILPAYGSTRGGTHTLPQVLRHELAHIALHRHLASAGIPRWFNEGYAMWSAGQFDADAGWKLRLAFVGRRAQPLDSLTLDWPWLEADAQLAYLLSASAVRYLYSLGTGATFDRFVGTWHERQSFEQALRETYTLTSPQFERLWRAHVKRQFGWLQFFAQSAFIWAVLTLLVLMLFVIRRRRDRRKLALLRAAEPPDEPAFWLGHAEPAGDEQQTSADAERKPPAD